MSGPLAANLGIGPRAWLFLSLLSCLALFFKFNRAWSVRNMDVLLLFSLAPGTLALVAPERLQPWGAFVWLFVASALWLARCLADLGLSRRPLLEPNLNVAGLTCVAVGVLGLLAAEAFSRPVGGGSASGPAETAATEGEKHPPVPSELAEPMKHVIRAVPLPAPLRRSPPQVILGRVGACLALLIVVVGLMIIGRRHFERPFSGLAMATCYVLLPYTRIALAVDTGPLVPSALIVSALVLFQWPTWAGTLIGLACGWMPACLALVPLWIGFYRGRGAQRFAAAALGVLGLGAALGWLFPGLSDWAPVIDLRTLLASGLVPSVDAPAAGNFWSGIEPTYRLPILILYLALVATATFLPAQKDLGSLISLSAALMVAAQFWYLGTGGALVQLYLPLVLLMMFRPNLTSKRPDPLLPRGSRRSRPVPSVA